MCEVGGLMRQGGRKAAEQGRCLLVLLGGACWRCYMIKRQTRSWQGCGVRRGGCDGCGSATGDSSRTHFTVLTHVNPGGVANTRLGIMILNSAAATGPIKFIHGSCAGWEAGARQAMDCWWGGLGGAGWCCLLAGLHAAGYLCQRYGISGCCDMAIRQKVAG